MKRISKTVAVAALLGSGVVSAAQLDFEQVIRQVASVRFLDWLPATSKYAVTVPVSGGAGLSMNVYAASYGSNVLASLTGRNFNAAQQASAGKFVAHVALKCFNLLPERRNAIIQWVGTQLARGGSASAMFGPLSIQVTVGNVNTDIELNREGTPGRSPWTNYCLPDAN